MFQIEREWDNGNWSKAIHLYVPVLHAAYPTLGEALKQLVTLKAQYHGQVSFRIVSVILHSDELKEFVSEDTGKGKP